MHGGWWWACFQLILDLLTVNHSDRGPWCKWQCVSSLKYKVDYFANFQYLLFQDQKGVLEMSIRGHQDVFEVRKDILVLELKIFSFPDLSTHN